MGVENGKEKRTVEAALSEELASLLHCFGVTVKEKGWPRIGCIWQKLYPTWAHPKGLRGKCGVLVRLPYCAKYN